MMIKNAKASREELKELLEKKFSDRSVEIRGIGAGKHVVVSESAMKGVDVVSMKKGILVQPSMVPSFGALLLLAALCLFGLIPGLIFGALVRAGGKELAEEVGTFLKGEFPDCGADEEPAYPY